MKEDICPSRDDAQPHIYEKGRCVLCDKPQCTCLWGGEKYEYCPTHAPRTPSHHVERA